MKKILLLFFSAILSLPALCQIEVDSIFIYKGITRGGTTARLQWNHRDLAARNSIRKPFDQSEISVLENLFFRTKKKRFFQQKHGGTVYYALVWFKGKKYHYVLEGNENFARMVNLSTMRKWTLEDIEKVKTFFEIVTANYL